MRNQNQRAARTHSPTTAAGIDVGPAMAHSLPDDRQHVGVVAVIRDGAVPLPAGARLIFANSDVSWQRTIDVPKRHMTGLGEQAAARLVNATSARLAGGPKIDFSAIDAGRNRDLWLKPHSGALGDAFDASQKMDLAAAVAAAKEINHAYKTRGSNAVPCDRLDSVFPEAYVAFNATNSQAIYAMATTAEEEVRIYYCPSCFGQNFPEEFGEVERGDAEGTFFGKCPRCGYERLWRDVDASVMGCPRQFNRAFREQFCRALADGLPLRLDRTATYVGAKALDVKDTWEDSPTHVSLHRFAAEDGTHFSVTLPPRKDVIVGVKPGETVAAGQIWATLSPDFQDREQLKRFQNMPSETRWKNLGRVCGERSRERRNYFEFLARAWFNGLAVRHGEFVLYPAELVLSGRRDFPPLALFWDFGGPTAQFRRQLQVGDVAVTAYVLPPIGRPEWAAQRFTVGAVDLNVAARDPRIAAAAENDRRERLRSKREALKATREETAAA